MWKLVFEYEKGSKCIVTGKQKSIPMYLLEKYYHRYGRNAKRAVYQQYPVKSNPPVDVHAWAKSACHHQGD